MGAKKCALALAEGFEYEDASFLMFQLGSFQAGSFGRDMGRYLRWHLHPQNSHYSY